MEFIFDFATVPAITVITYWLIECLKIIAKNNEDFMRFIPVIATGIGVALGVIIYFAFPGMIVASNVVFAVVTGGCSGLAATGSNQLMKQLKKYKTEPVKPVDEK